MRTATLDQLVQEITDQILGRLAPAPVAPSCGCSGGASAAAPAKPAGSCCTAPVAPSTLTGAPAQSAPAAEGPVAALIDHTLLKPDATDEQIGQLCAEAREHGFATVCVNPYRVALAARLLAGSQVKVCTVVGFPLGATFTEVKVLETDIAIRCGAREIDMVLNIGALKSGDLDRVKQDIAAVVAEAHASGVAVKVILETALLTDKEKAVASALAVLAGADFVKTSTGFAAHGATEADVSLLRLAAGPGTGVKASGGIRTREDLDRMRQAGASRIGTSSGVQIVSGGNR